MDIHYIIHTSAENARKPGRVVSRLHFKVRAQVNAGDLFNDTNLAFKAFSLSGSPSTNSLLPTVSCTCLLICHEHGCPLGETKHHQPFFKTTSSGFK